MDPEIIVGVDPKLTGSGYAIVRGSRLVACGLLSVPRATKDLEGRIECQTQALRHIVTAHGAVSTVVGELPVVYPGPRQIATPEDLIQLAGLVCGIAYGLGAARVLLPRPREWKGTLPKDVHHRRLATAHPAAVSLVRAAAPPSKQHDVWDAVGLAYWYVARRDLE